MSEGHGRKQPPTKKRTEEQKPELRSSSVVGDHRTEEKLVGQMCEELLCLGHTTIARGPMDSFEREGRRKGKEGKGENEKFSST
jgi:hypothetical protein